MEKLKAIFGTIFGAIILALIIWIILFFTVPKVKTWTKEKIFNQPKQEQTETKEEEQKTASMYPGLSVNYDMLD